MIDTKKLAEYLKLLEELVEKTKGGTEDKTATSLIDGSKKIEKLGTAYYTVKVKARLLKEIKEALEKIAELKDDSDEGDWKSLAMSVDQITNIVKLASKELKDHKELEATSSKIEKMTHSWISDIYGTDKSYERRDRDEDEEKEEKKKEEKEFTKSVENSFLKLVEKLSKVGSSVWEIFRDSSYKSKEERDATEDRVRKIDALIKRIKRDMPSEEIEEEHAKKLLQLAVKLKELGKNGDKETDYTNAIDSLTKTVAKHIQSAVVKSESSKFDAEMILEFFEFCETHDVLTEDEVKIEKPNIITESYYDKTNWLL